MAPQLYSHRLRLVVESIHNKSNMMCATSGSGWWTLLGHQRIPNFCYAIRVAQSLVQFSSKMYGDSLSFSCHFVVFFWLQWCCQYLFDLWILNVLFLKGTNGSFFKLKMRSQIIFLKYFLWKDILHFVFCISFRKYTRWKRER